MKQTRILLPVLASLFFSFSLAAQKRLTEATIAYDIVINTSNETPQAADLLDGATSVIYLKGNSSRSEMISSLGTQATIIDGKVVAERMQNEIAAQVASFKAETGYAPGLGRFRTAGRILALAV